MRYRRMGQTGLLVSELGFGTWATIGEKLDLEESSILVRQAYDLGVNLFDTAGVYAGGACEEMLGAIFAREGWPRETYVLSTKVMWGTGDKSPNQWGLSKKHIVEAVEAALKRLRLSYIDILLCHRPDPNTPVEETLEAIDLLIRSGKVFYWGTSHWPASLLGKAKELCAYERLSRPVAEQTQYNLFERERVEKELACLIEQGIGLCAWSPLSYGLIAGRGLSPSNPGRIDQPGMEWLRQDALGNGKAEKRRSLALALQEIAKAAGTTAPALGLSWVLGNMSVSSAITGASAAHHLADNIRRVESIDDLGKTRVWLDEQLSQLGFTSIN